MTTLLSRVKWFDSAKGIGFSAPNEPGHPDVFLTDVYVDEARIVGAKGEGFKHIMAGLEGERLIAAAQGLGMLERTIDDLLEYVKERKQFGKAIGTFQALRHRIADIATEAECCRTLTYELAQRYDANPQDPALTRLTSMAKLKVGRLCREVTDSCLQYWGGMGFTLENSVSRAFRDLRLISIGGGADEIMLQIICKHMGILPKR